MLQRYIGVFVRCALLVALVFASLAIQASTASGAVLQPNYTASNPCQAPAQPPAAVCDYSSTTNSVGGASNPYELGSFSPSALGIPESDNLFCGNFDHALGYYGGNETTYTATPPTPSPQIGFLTSTQEQTTSPVNADATQVAIWNLLGENPGNPTDSSAAHTEQILLGEASSQEGPYSADVTVSSNDAQATLSIYDASGSLFNGAYVATVTITSTSGASVSQAYVPEPTTPNAGATVPNGAIAVSNSGSFQVSLPVNTQEVSVAYTFLPSTQVVYYRPASPQYQGFYTSGPLGSAKQHAFIYHTPATYTISVEKTGNDQPYYSVAGAVFNVYSGNNGASGTLETPGGLPVDTPLPNGTWTTPISPRLPAGTYSIVETTPPKGYAAEYDQVITIPTAGEPSGGNTVVSFTNGLQDYALPGELQVNKLDGETGGPLKGAVFSFAYDSNDGASGNPANYTSSGFLACTPTGGCQPTPGTCTTNAQGVCAPPPNDLGGNGAPFSGLLPGYYMVTETQAPDGFPVPPNPTQTVYVPAGANGAGPPPPTNLYFYDWPGALQVQKSGNDTPYYPIAGAVFNATGPSPSTASVGTLTVGANGLSNVLSQLAVGDYTLTETQAPNGYQLSPPQSIAVTNPTNGPYVTVANVKDYVIPAQLSVYKTDASTNKPVSGATFSFAYAPTPGGGYTQSLGSCTTQITATNTTGACAPPGNDQQLVSIVPLVYKTVGFLPGDYQITETHAPGGYALPKNPMDVTATATTAAQSFAFSDKEIPTITTTAASPNGMAVGGQLTDSVVIGGLASTTTATMDWTVYGPLAPTSNLTCHGLTWPGAQVFASGSMPIEGSGTVLITVPTPPTQAGCYDWSETILSNKGESGASSPPGSPGESALVYPSVVSVAATTATTTQDAAITDTLTFDGITPGTIATYVDRLYGPAPLGTSGQCSASSFDSTTPLAGTVSLAPSSSGTYTTASVPVTAPGCYGWYLTMPAWAGVQSLVIAPTPSERALLAPTIATTASTNGVVAAGTAVYDTVTVPNLDNSAAQIASVLYGPLAPNASGTCTGLSWTNAPIFWQATTSGATAAGVLQTATATPTSPGCYSYGTTLLATSTNGSISMAPGAPSETFEIAPSASGSGSGSGASAGYSIASGSGAGLVNTGDGAVQRPGARSSTSSELFDSLLGLALAVAAIAAVSRKVNKRATLRR